MRIRALVVLVLAAAPAVACGGREFFRQYEYEEEMYLSLDGTATLYVNSSVPALAVLRGVALDTRSNARLDRDAIRAFYTSGVTRVRQISESRRSNRRFVQVRLDVDDVRRLAEAAPFAWSAYRFDRDRDLYVYRQSVGPAVDKTVGSVGWNGGEIVAFRLHLPSKIAYHNTGSPVRRGNILVWEQSLTDRLRGVPLTFDARMETQSILYRTLWLFGTTMIAVVFTFGFVVWWIVRRGARRVRT